MPTRPPGRAAYEIRLSRNLLVRPGRTVRVDTRITGLLGPRECVFLTESEPLLEQWGVLRSRLVQDVGSFSLYLTVRNEGRSALRLHKGECAALALVVPFDVASNDSEE